MDKSTSEEYIFWLRNWKDPSISFWSKAGQFKCTLTKSKLSIISRENDPDKELSVALSLIRGCNISPGGQYSNQLVEISLNDRKISLSPVTPFDPKTILMGNHAEAYALRNTIDALRSDMDPQIDGNPYVRQLAEKANIKRFDGSARLMKDELTRLEKLNQNWDAHVSPWVYSDLYGNRFLYLKTLAKIVTMVLLSAIIAVLAILIIAYVLDNLNII
jgi:hypothetical protein